MKLFKYKLIIFFIIFILSTTSVNSNLINNKISLQNIVKISLWQQFFGGESDDVGFKVIENNNKEYVTVGWTKSFGSGSDDVWLIKTDHYGHMLWNKTFGGKSSDRGFSVKQTIDYGYIITGYTSSFGNGIYDLWLIKTDEFGNEEWNCTYGGGDFDYGLDIIVLNDDGFIITGYTSSFGPPNCNIWLIRTDNFGDLIWNKVFGGNYCESGFSVIEDNGNYIISGYTESFGPGGYDGFIIKTRNDGSIIWNKTYGGAHTDVIRSVEKNEIGGYIAIGWSESYGSNNEDLWIINLDSNGDIIWNKTYNIGYNDEGYSISKTSSDGYIIAGSSQNLYLTDTDFLLFKINNIGEKEWSKTFGGFSDEFAYDITNTSDGGFIITGYSASYGSGRKDIWLIKTNEDGKIFFNSNRMYKNLLFNLNLFDNIIF
jgi:hypothetical protein